MAPIPPADIKIPISSGNLSLGYHTAKALKAPINAPETPKPIADVIKPSCSAFILRSLLK